MTKRQTKNNPSLRQPAAAVKNRHKNNALIACTDRARRIRIKEALLQRALQNHAILQTAMDGFWIVDADGRLLDVNDAYCEMSGYSRDELLQMRTGDLEVVTPQHQVWARDHNVVSPKGDRFETTHRRKDGHVLHLEVSLQYLEGNDGRGFAFLHDITERKQNEAALQKSEYLLLESQRIASMGHYELDIIAGRWKSSETLYSVFGTDANYQTDLDGWLHVVHPDDRDAMAAYFAGDVLEQRQDFNKEYRIRRISDGKTRWVHGLGRLEFDQQGMPVRMLGNIQDITERKQAELAIQESERRFRETLENVQLIAVSLDLNGNIVFCNDFLLTLTGWEREDLLGRNWFDVCLPPDVAPDVQKIFLQSISTGTTPGYHENVILTRNGQRRQVVWSNTMLRDIQGEVVGTASIGQDVTESRRSEQALRTKTEELEAVARENLQLFSSIQRTNLELQLAYDATIEGWSRALELRDQETEGHTLRVTEMTLKLARRMGGMEADLDKIRHGALLHDIGKIGVPDRILLKPERLTPEEWDVMKRHTVYAFEMLWPIEFLRPAIDIPHFHHERWDGTGYPNGLKGENIPLAARIFAIADVWDALTNDRPYRRAWSREQARTYIQENRALHFDPRVVDIFLELMEREPKGL